MNPELRVVSAMVGVMTVMATAIGMVRMMMVMLTLIMLMRLMLVMLVRPMLIGTASPTVSCIYGHPRVVTWKSERNVHLLCA